MAFQKNVPSVDAPPTTMKSLNFSIKGKEKSLAVQERNRMEDDVDIDLREVYFLIMHFLSGGPCHRTYGQLWNELLEHHLLPRRFHAWYSRSGTPSGDENDDGLSFPLSYNKLVERYPHIEKDHMVKLLKQLIRNTVSPSKGVVSGNTMNASAVPTLLGTGSFSLLTNDQSGRESQVKRPPAYMRWPHTQADQVRGLSLREICGGFSRHHRAPSIRAACYAVAKPSTMVQKMQNIKKVRGHRDAVYCAIFDRSGRYVITGSDDRLVKIWSMETAYCLSSCRGHEGDITDLAVNFNNTMVASASNDCNIRVWRLADGVPISVLRGHIGAVTAIAFNPRPSSVYQLLSSSDDGSCRIWDARNSQFRPRIYVPKPQDPGKSSGPSSSTGQQSHQIFCCAFNASGTVFVTGSSDTRARVWSAIKSNTEDSEQPNHEMDVLNGHGNDVNYVQFSGSAVESKFLTSDALKEENVPKFKNTWFTHDNIVTCSRDGSAIIWIPRSRRSHGKAGRWTQAYHLKVPPPPMPPQPLRGGPRQRIPPTPRGVNMIVWSLDNRFVLAAIMDCRICVWNAVDGSLVHSLTGHTDSTYILDVHPFNPRIAMSAGYDGKTIVWDIWEGIPIWEYEIGKFRLVDGKFSPDGTSIILSDNAGQLYILSTGQGESQEDAKYEQFFLGDYRPLIHDTHGNVLDQETQLVPYRRNMQDLLCDAGMIPYEDPYQSIYQKRRLGALGIEWRPSSVRFAVGTDITLDQDYHMLPIADLDILLEPLPEFIDAMDWEPENEIQSDDNDSEYNVTDSGGEQGSLSSHSSSDRECSSEESEDENEDGLRRSRRKKPKAEVEVTSSSGRRIKRKNLDECEENSVRNKPSRKSRNGRKASRKKSSSKSFRPQRAAARNALHFFSRITGTSTDGEEEYCTSGSSSEVESIAQDSNLESEESDVSLQNEENGNSKGKQVALYEPDSVDRPHDDYPESNTIIGKKKRLVLKFPNRNSSKLVDPENMIPDVATQTDVAGSASTASQGPEVVTKKRPLDLRYSSGDENGDKIGRSELDKPPKVENHLDLLEGYTDRKISWGGVKARTPKRFRSGEPLPSGVPGSSLDVGVNIESSVVNGKSIPGKDHFDDGTSGDLDGSRFGKEHSGTNDCKDNRRSSKRFLEMVDERATSSVPYNNGIHDTLELKENPTPAPTRLRIRSSLLSRDHGNPIKMKFKSAVEDSRNGVYDTLPESSMGTRPGLNLEVPDCEDTERQTLGSQVDRRFRTVYKRSKSFRTKSNLEGDCGGMEASVSNAGNHIPDEGTERIRWTRSATRDVNVGVNNIKFRVGKYSSEDTSTSVEMSPINDPPIDEWRTSARSAVGLRSTRSRRASHYVHESITPDRKKSNQSARSSWLMLSTHEEGSRYIPQQGDEVAYLRQGHQEYMETISLIDSGPWRTINGNIRAVEFCRVDDLQYATCSGSGESCCKLTLFFIDPTSKIAGKSFVLTLPELTGFPDFLVERSRFDAALDRNWTLRDRCHVWWTNEGDEDGCWWEGKVVGVTPKSPNFPESPWERYEVKYKENPPLRHSPWELYDAPTRWEQPRIDPDIRDKLLHAFAKLEQSGNRTKDHYGVQKLKQVSQRSQFQNRFAVPLSLEVIHSRLENNYYRTLDAIKHDISVMLYNAEQYFGKNAELLTKMENLSNWFDRTILPL